MTLRAAFACVTLSLGVGCSSGNHNSCHSQADCAQGNVCLSGICQPSGDSGTGDGGYRVACGAPPDAGLSTIPIAAGDSVFVLSMAWGGNEAGLAYVDTASTGTSAEAYLQRFSGDGHALVATNLGAVLTNGTSVPVATDGSRYIACWQPGDFIFQCASTPVGGGVATLHSFDGGNSPAVAFGVSGFVAAFYFDSMGLVAQQLDANANPVGAAVTELAPGNNPTIALASTQTEYALAATNLNGPVQLYRLGPTLQAGSAIQVSAGPADGFNVSVAASGDTVGVAWIDSSGNGWFATVSASDTVSTPVSLGQVRGTIAIAGASQSFALSWTFAPTGPQIVAAYQAFNLSGSSVASPTLVQGLTIGGSNYPTAIASVADGFLFAWELGNSGTPVQVVHLTCP
jgi:hypothetical protein